MHEPYDEWEEVLLDLETYPTELTEDEKLLLEKLQIDPDLELELEALVKLEAVAESLILGAVSLTISLSAESGVVISTDGHNELLMISLLASLLKGDLDDDILDSLEKYKVLFPSWGDEAPLIYPDRTLWENTDEEK
jgi:hypothetical protein